MMNNCLKQKHNFLPNQSNMKNESLEMVDHPKHYQSDGGIEAIDVIESFKLGFNLGNAIKYILRAESKGNKLVVNGEIDDSIEINSDAVRISQLFYNIVGNAVKFTEKGIITIDVTTENKTNENIILIASVTDTGKGISAADLKNVFEDFYQSEASKSLSGMGVGLGLKLCKEIVELFKGSIDINSDLNKGTKVSFRIQLQLSKK